MKTGDRIQIALDCIYVEMRGMKGTVIREMIDTMVKIKMDDPIPEPLKKCFYYEGRIEQNTICLFPDRFKPITNE